MWQLLEAPLRKLDSWRQRHNIARALNLRQEVRPDGLRLLDSSHRLELRWTARGVHPWDRELPPESGAASSLEQSLADAEAAILRLFDALPYVDIIDFSVVDPASGRIIIAGAVHRSTLGKVRNLLSLHMRLKVLGVRFSLSGLPPGAEPG